MKAIKKLLNEHIFILTWIIFIIGNNPITINKGNNWFFAIVFLLSWVSCAVLLLKHLFINTDLIGKFKNILLFFCLNIVSVIAFFFMAFLFSCFEKYYEYYHRKVHISGSLYLFDVFQMLLIMGIIISLYCFVYSITISRFKGLEISNLKRIFFTTATVSMFLIRVIFFMFGFAPEFAGNLFW
jgi:hypothetical protein